MSALTGILSGQALKPYVVMVLAVAVLFFIVSFCYLALLPALPAAAAFGACYVSIMLVAAAFWAFGMPELYYLQGFMALCFFILAFLVRFCLKSCNI